MPQQETCQARLAVMLRKVSLFVFLSASGQGMASELTYEHLSFDGLNDHVWIASSSSLQITQRLTVEAWIRPRNIAPDKNQDRVVAKGTDFELTVSSGDTGCHFGTSGHVQWRAVIGGVDRRVCGGALSLGSWQHVAGTYDGARFTLYIDGVAVASAARTGALATSTQALILGNRAAADRPFDGDLDEVRIWNVARTAAQLSAGMTQALTGAEAGLAAYYRLDEGGGQTAADATPQANHGRLGGSSAADAGDPAWVRLGAPSNQPPVVSAGPDRSAALPGATVNLDGTVTDDDLPSGALLTTWSVAAGPGPVSFGDPGAVDTTASFSVAGTYQLELTASDGELSAGDTVHVSIADEPALTTIEVAPSSVTLAAGQARQFTATGRDHHGNAIPVSPTWAASGGTITPSGQYSAPASAGTYSVTATQNGVSGSAVVEVQDASSGIWPTNGWITATPAEMGMNATRLKQARNYALKGGGAGFITRGGRLVLSWGNATTLFDLKSTTKSFGSLLLGLALDDHLLQLSDSAQQHLPTIGIPPSENQATGWLDDLTILQLATHTAGFEKPQGYPALAAQPGTRWNYSDGGANWLADLLTVRNGRDLNAVLFSRALTALGVTPAHLQWRNNTSREDTIDGIKRRELSSGIHASVDALARVGYLFLRRGEWEGQRILPVDFVDFVRRPHPSVVGLPVGNPVDHPNGSDHYGVLWWTNADGTLPQVPRDAYWAWGLRDSLIVVIPSLDIVVSRAGSGWRTGWSADYSVLAGFLNPIVASVATTP